MRRAVERAAADFIEPREDAYARVGERGNKLSGGERQRLSIARAFSRTRRSSFSTRPPARSTPRPKRKSAPRWPR